MIDAILLILLLCNCAISVALMVVVLKMYKEYDKK
jgi:hypothetical protein